MFVFQFLFFMRLLTKSLLFILIFFSSEALMAQVTIKGVIKDNKNIPVTGASITIKDSYDGATSDSTGSYLFKTTEKGQQILLITNLGYKPFEQSVKL